MPSPSAGSNAGGRASARLAQPRGFGSPLEWLLVAAFLLTLLVFGYQGLTGSDGGLRAEQDHTITLSFSQRLVDTGRYPADFFYPLPAVVLKLALGLLGTEASSLVWMALMLLAACGCLEALRRLVPNRGPGPLALPGFLGALAIVYCVQWDFRAVNANTVFLALALQGLAALDRKPAAVSGFLLAGSIALKLYSAPLLMVVAARRAWGVVAWACFAGFVFFVGLPVLWFGPAQAASFSSAFIDQLWGASGFGAVRSVTAYNVSLWRVFEGLQPGAGGLGLWLSRGLGLTVLAATVLRSARSRCRPDLLLEAASVWSAMLLMSPIAQPHHGVVLWPLSAILAQAALDPGRSGRPRMGASVALGFGAAALILAPSGVGKAMALHGVALGWLAVAWWDRLTRAGGTHQVAACPSTQPR